MKNSSPYEQRRAPSINHMKKTEIIILTLLLAGLTAIAGIGTVGVTTTNTPSVELGWSAALEDDIVVKQVWVSGADTVSVRVRNTDAVSSVDPAAVTCRATVTSF